MKWREPIKRTTKKGSYIVEAALVVPIFILSVVMLMSMVPIITACENAVFAITDELRYESAKSAIRQNGVVLPAKLNGRIYMENSKVSSYRTRNFRYLYRKHEIDDLMTLDFRIVFQGDDPMGIFNAVAFDGTITARAFTGKLHQSTPDSGNDVTEKKIVYIFPEWGMRYHGKTCTYVKANCQMVYLSQKIKKAYRPCKLCNAKSAQIGSPVFCFMVSGQVYHLADCRSVDKYYVQIEKQKAVDRGYTPCSRCGGTS